MQQLQKWRNTGKWTLPGDSKQKLHCIDTDFVLCENSVILELYDKKIKVTSLWSFMTAQKQNTHLSKNELVIFYYINEQFFHSSSYKEKFKDQQKHVFKSLFLLL